MNHTHTLLTCLLERANNSVKRTDIPLIPSVSRLPQTSEYYRRLCDKNMPVKVNGKILKTVVWRDMVNDEKPRKETGGK